MSATAWDVPASNSSVPASVRTKNASVTHCEWSESIDEIRPGEGEENEDGGDAKPGSMVGLAEFNVDGDNDDER